MTNEGEPGVKNEDMATVRELRRAQIAIGDAWQAADDADEDDVRKSRIATALRDVERVLRVYGALVPR